MKIILSLIFLILPIFASSQVYSNLGLSKAIKILKKDNLEINVAKFDEKIKNFKHNIAKGYKYGKLDLVQLAMRSNDAGNIFGFKLQSREASFADFGFSEFLTHTPSPLDPSVLAVQPKDLNYPDARNHFQTKLHYEVPIYTGGKLEQYDKITSALTKLSKLDTKKIINEKVYQLKKSYFDIYLLDLYLKNLNIIEKNMSRLENMAQSMINEGYAKKVDLLEVQSKKANVTRMINTAKVNKKLALSFVSFLLNSRVKSVAGNYRKVMPKTFNINEILAKNIDIKKVEEGLKITNMNIKLQESANLPKVGAFAEYSSADNNFLHDFRKHDAYTVGIQFKWNLFNGGINEANIQKARVRNLKVKTQEILAKRGIALRVEKIKTQIQSMDFDINSLNKEIELTRTIYKNYLGRYQEKLVSINDVIIKQSLEIEKVLKLKEVENNRSDKILELEKIANGEEI
ncbi:MAG: TolC family protein [Epsilonproteobacteria bacterium]|nr:TolC family protein [Campylobacterota bacterium]